jgi:hypothetical protein
MKRYLSKTVFMRRLAFGLAAVALSWFGGSVQAATVAMVLDVQGKVVATVAGGPVALGIAKSLPADTRVSLPAGAKLSLTHYATQEHLTLAGPAQALLTGKGLQMIEGAAPQSRKLAGDSSRVVEEFQGRVVPAAMMMRSVGPKPTLDVPRNGEVLLDDTLEIGVSLPSGGAEIKAELFQGERLLGSRKLDGSALRLRDIAGMALTAGHQYQLMIGVANARFTIADAVTRQSLEALRPTDETAIDQWVIYAMALEQQRAVSAARAVWQRVANERPELAENLGRLVK